MYRVKYNFLLVAHLRKPIRWTVKYVSSILSHPHVFPVTAEARTHQESSHPFISQDLHHLVLLVPRGMYCVLGNYQRPQCECWDAKCFSISHYKHSSSKWVWSRWGMNVDGYRSIQYYIEMYRIITIEYTWWSTCQVLMIADCLDDSVIFVQRPRGNLSKTCLRQQFVQQTRVSLNINVTLDIGPDTRS